MLKPLYMFFSKRDKKGFTLIELLIVVAIIAILAAIAIPQFSAYRKRGYNASANSDLRNMRTSEEAMYADFTDYGVTRAANDAAPQNTAQENVTAGGSIYLAGGRSTTITQAVSLSPGVYCAVRVTGAGGGVPNTAYTVVTTHQTGDQYYGADSDVTTLYRQGWTGTYAANNTLGKTPASTAGASNFDNTWTAIQ